MGKLFQSDYGSSPSAINNVVLMSCDEPD